MSQGTLPGRLVELAVVVGAIGVGSLILAKRLKGGDDSSEDTGHPPASTTNLGATPAKVLTEDPSDDKPRLSSDATSPSLATPKKVEDKGSSITSFASSTASPSSSIVQIKSGNRDFVDVGGRSEVDDFDEFDDDIEVVQNVELTMSGSGMSFDEIKSPWRGNDEEADVFDSDEEGDAAATVAEAETNSSQPFVVPEEEIAEMQRTAQVHTETLSAWFAKGMGFWDDKTYLKQAEIAKLVDAGPAADTTAA